MHNLNRLQRSKPFPSRYALTNNIKMNTGSMSPITTDGVLLEVLSLTIYNSHMNIFVIGISLSNSHSNISRLKHGKGDTLLFLATITWWSGKGIFPAPGLDTAMLSGQVRHQE